MTATIGHYLTRYRWWTLASYAAVLLAMFIVCASTLVDLARGYSELSAGAERLSQFERRIPRGTRTSAVPAPPGQPLLDELTPTIASAALMQRMASAIAGVGGTMVSSEADPQNAQSKDGHIKISATFSLEPNALQQLLYEVEGGMPFLFVDQLLTQQDPELNKNGQLRVTLVVTGLWKAPK